MSVNFEKKNANQESLKKDNSPAEQLNYISPILDNGQENPYFLTSEVADNLQTQEQNINSSEKLQEINDSFVTILSFFEANNVFLPNKEAFVKLYTMLPEENRIPLNTIEDQLTTPFKSLLQKHPEVSEMFADHDNDFSAAFQSFCSADDEKADEILSQISYDINKKTSISDLLKTINIKGLLYSDAEFLYDNLEANGVDPIEANSIIPKIQKDLNLSELDVDPKTKMQLLVNQIILYKSGQSNLSKLFLDKDLVIHREQAKLEEIIANAEKEKQKIVYRGEKSAKGKDREYQLRKIQREKNISESLKQKGKGEEAPWFYQKLSDTLNFRITDYMLANAKMEASEEYKNRFLAEGDKFQNEEFFKSEEGKVSYEKDKLSREYKIAEQDFFIQKSKTEIFALSVRQDLLKQYLLKNPNASDKVINEIIGIDQKNKNSNEEESSEILKIAKKYKLDSPASLAFLAMMESDLSIQSYQLEAKSREYHNYEIHQKYFKTGVLDNETKEYFAELLESKQEKYLNALKPINEQILVEDKYFESLKVKNIEQLPEQDQMNVAQRLNSYQGLLASAYRINKTLSSVAYSFQILSNDSGSFDETVSDQIKGKMNKVAKFMDGEVPEESFSQVDQSATSELQGKFLEKEINPIIKPATDSLVRVGKEYSETTGGIEKKFRQFANLDPWGRKIQHGSASPEVIFNEVIKDFDSLQNNIKSTRSVFGNTKVELQKELEIDSKDPAIANNPILANLRKVKILQAIAQIDLLLNSPKSPLSDTFLNNLAESAKKIAEEKNKFVDQEIKNLATTMVIMTVAIASGVGFAFASSAIASGASLGVATSTLMNIFAMTAGATAGQVSAMYLTDAMNLSHFKESNKLPFQGDPSSPNNWRIQFMTNFAYSGVFYGASAGVMKSAGYAKTLKNAPRLAAAGENVENFMLSAKKLLSPVEFGEFNLKNFASRFGIKYVEKVGEEFVEETIENIAQAINPALGALASTINSADGININTNLGIEFEHGRPVYTEDAPTNLISKLNSRLNSKGAKMDYEVDNNGIVNVKVTKDGETIEFDIYPSAKKLGRVAIKGLELNTSSNKFEITNPENTMPALADLQSKGYVFEDSADGILVASRGKERIEIALSPEVIATFHEIGSSFKELNTLVQSKKTATELTEGDVSIIRTIAEKLKPILEKLGIADINRETLSNSPLFTSGFLFGGDLYASSNKFSEANVDQAGVGFYVLLAIGIYATRRYILYPVLGRTVIAGGRLAYRGVAGGVRAGLPYVGRGARGAYDFMTNPAGRRFKIGGAGAIIAAILAYYLWPKKEEKRYNPFETESKKEKPGIIESPVEKTEGAKVIEQKPEVVEKPKEEPSKNNVNMKDLIDDMPR